jgi:hemolysin activation/secretion protein
MFLFLALAAASAPPQDARAPLLIDRDRVDRPRAPATKPLRAPEKQAVAQVATRGADVTITGVRFRGSQAPARVAAAAQKFLGRTADPKTLQALATALSEAYGQSDVALYTVGIPQQSFAGGTVDVLLTEATVAQAAIVGDPKDHPRLAERMAPLLKERPLSRRTFERQLTLMRSIPGLTVDPQLTDPSGTGALALTVTPRQRDRKFTLGFSNRGVDLLGDGQFDARAEFYGLARNGDQLALSASAASDLKRYRLASAAYAVPVSADGLTLSANAAYLETRPRGSPIRGTAKLGGATLSYPAVRSFHTAADVTLGFDGIDSDNAVFGNLLATERTRALRAAAGISDTRERRSLSLSGSLSKGLDVLGARVTAPLADTSFTKVTLNAGIAQAIGQRGAIRLNASAQYSGDALPAAERFALGGEAVGRAFDTGLLTGDRGVGGLAELAWRPLAKGNLSTSELYTFVDGGAVGIAARGLSPGGDYGLASAGIGGRLRFRDKGELGLEAARTIDDPYPGYGDDWRFSVAWRLSL